MLQYFVPPLIQPHVSADSPKSIIQESDHQIDLLFEIILSFSPTLHCIWSWSNYSNYPICWLIEN